MTQIFKKYNIIYGVKQKKNNRKVIIIYAINQMPGVFSLI